MPNWGHVLKEISKETNDPGGESAVDKVRKRYLKELHDYTDRNLIAYYSGFLSKPKIEGIELNDEDKNGFMLATHKLDKKKGLDIFIHTPGGNIAATESLVHYLKTMFGLDMRAFVPQIAMSAGTMLACACKEIYMGTHSNLGPVDPSISGIQAQAVLAEIEEAWTQMKNDQSRAYIWNPILSQYTPSFVKLCQWAVERSEEFVRRSLIENMFSDLPAPEREAKVQSIVSKLIDLSKNRGHDKHIHIDDCRDIGLKVVRIEDDKKLQDLVLTVHHCYMHTLSNTGAFKIVENHLGRRMVKMQVEQFALIPQQVPPLAPPQKVA